MTALDFIMYCSGFGIVAVSAGIALRLTSGMFRQGKAETTSSESVWQPITEPSAEGLEKRLLEFQTARYSSPIVQRSLSDDAGPRQRSFPQPTQRPQGIRAPSPSRPLRIEPNANQEKVIHFPQKMRRDNDTPKKED